MTFFIELDENSKVNLAADLTKLALEHNILREHSCPEDTANEICTFFKTLFHNLDKALMQQCLFKLNSF